MASTAEITAAIAALQSLKSNLGVYPPELVPALLNLQQQGDGPGSNSSMSTGNYATATNAAATITYAAAGSGVSHIVDGIAFSLSANPANAVALTVSDGASVVMSIDILAGGAGFLPFKGKGSANTAMTITLGAGGSGVIGKVSVLSKGTSS